MTIVRGHEHAWSSLVRTASHAFAFVGPDGVGRRTTAIAWASWLNCTGRSEGDATSCGSCDSCRQYATGLGPDLLVKGPRTATRSGRAARRRSVPIDAIVRRGGPSSDPEPLTEWVSARPHGRARVAVVDAADTMNEAASNALLKTLEEPPSWARIVLIAASTASLLPTVVSRCTVIRFGASEVSAFGHLDPHPALRTGSIGPLIRADADPETTSRVRTASDAFVGALDGSLDEAWRQAMAWADVREEAPDLADGWLLEVVRARDPRWYASAVDAVLEARDAFEAYAARSVVVGTLVLRLRRALG